MRWKLPATSAVLTVVALTVAGALVGWLIRGPIGLMAGAIPGALAAVVAGYVPTFRDRAEHQEAERSRAEAAFRAVREPSVEPSLRGPTAWLQPDKRVVEFIGRSDELEVLRGWCTGDQERSVAVIVGPAGVGKTRLALEIAAYWEAEGGTWVLVADEEEGNAVAAARGVTSGRLLLVIDYAETRLRLDVMFRAVLNDPGSIRVLLIARSLGEWWERLVEKSSFAVAGLLTHAERLQLDAPIVSHASDAELAAAAVPYFAQKLGVSVPPQLKFEFPSCRTPVLVLHAAALVAVLRFVAEPSRPLRVVSLDEVVRELLAHEARYWWRSAPAAGLSDGGAVFKPVVAAATLLGAASMEEAAQLVTRIPELARTSSSEEWRWARWLYGLYPASDGGRLGTLQPDFLAETFVVGELAKNPAMAEAVLRDLSMGHARHALTLLARASVHEDRAKAIIVNALHADLGHLAIPAAQVAVQGQRELGGLLTAAVWDVPLPFESLAGLARALPYPSVILAEAQAAAVLKAHASLPPDTDSTDVAEWSHFAGHVLNELERLPEALEAAKEAVAAYRQLATTEPLRYNPDLASSLTTLGAILSRLGRRAEAILVTREAVAIYGDLAAAEPYDYGDDLANNLCNLGGYLAEVGRPDEALPIAEQAVAVCRELIRANPGAYGSLLARALESLGTRLGELGRTAAALTASQEGVAVYRELAAANPDRYRPGLAISLTNLGVRFRDEDRLAEAINATQEAVKALRELTADNPGRYRSSLAFSLSNLSLWVDAQDGYQESLPYAEEAVTIRRDLALTIPGYRPDLAKSLSDLSVCLYHLDRLSEAAETADEAVNIYRELISANPDRYGADLARSLMIQSMTLNDPVKALPIVQEAVALYRDTTSTYADGYQLDLAAALFILAKRSWEMGHHRDAIAAAEDAVTAVRKLVSVSPDRYQERLVTYLGVLAGLLSESDHPEEAIPHYQEGVTIIRRMADAHPNKYRDDLVEGLTVLATTLTKAGYHHEAEDARSEAEAIQKNFGSASGSTLDS